MRSVRFRAALAAPLVLSVALFGGCLSDSTPTADLAATNQSDEDIAQGVSGIAVETLGSMIDGVSGLQQNPLRGQSVQWDGGTGIWTISGDDAYDDPDATGNVTYTITVRFQANGTPQQYMDDTTDQIDVTTAATNGGNYHPQDRAFDVDYDFDITASIQAVPSGNLIAVTGSGSLSGSTDAHIGQATVSRSQSGSWTYALSFDPSVPDDCASGTFSGTTNNFTFDGTLQNGAAAWDIYRDGTLVRSATGTYSCGGSGSVQ